MTDTDQAVFLTNPEIPIRIQEDLTTERLTKRERFALVAMQGLLASGLFLQCYEEHMKNGMVHANAKHYALEQVRKTSFELADGMLREKPADPQAS